MSGVLASKQQSQKIFEKLKTKQANKVRPNNFARLVLLSRHERGFAYADAINYGRSASTAARRTRHGPRCPSVSTSASIALRTIVTSASTSPLSAPPTSIVSSDYAAHTLDWH